MVLELHLLQVLRLPGDVEVVRPGLHAGLHHGLAVEPVGAHAVEHDPCLLRHLVQGGGVAAVAHQHRHLGQVRPHHRPRPRQRRPQPALVPPRHGPGHLRTHRQLLPRPAHLVLHGGPVHVLDDELSGEAAGAVDDEVVLGHGGRGVSV